jgi:CheY-like chemotaxis protein
LSISTTPNTEKSSEVLRILLVDDEETVRETTAVLLRGNGYEVYTCSDGREAVEYYDKAWRQTELVILDMNMPVMNGRDAFIRMREINPEVRVILSTGFSLDASAREILDEGARAYIQKPFRIGELVERIEKVLSD